MADRPQEDGVHLRELGEYGFRQDLPGAEVSLPAEVVGLQVESDVFAGRGGPQRLERLPDDLRAGPVAGDDGNSKG